MRRSLIAACLLCLVVPTCAISQVVVVRNRRDIARRPAVPNYRIQEVEINATLKDQSASVQMAQVFENQSPRTIEAQFLFPMPHGAAISGLTLIVDGKELTGELKKREDARRIYENIVRQQKDPALLEYIGDDVFKTSVFPIPAGQKRRVEIRYTQLMKKESGLVDFTLPLGTFKHTQRPIEKTRINVRLNTTEPLKTVYSPTHDFNINRPEEDRARCNLVLDNITRPNDVRLLFGTKGGDVGMNLISYRPDKNKDGYFLLLASPRVKAKKKSRIPKTVVFVVDKSGSMSGPKIAQAKASLKYMINQLRDEDTFNIVAYSTEVESFRPEIEVVNEKTKAAALAYVEDIYSGGGTNIDGALTAALAQLKDPQRPSYVMFMTDGLPTVGTKDEKLIAANAKKLNEVSSRVFSFGVGYDVNSRLLDRLSRDNNGTSIFIKPTEDIEVAATNIFRKVSSPVLTSLNVKVTPEKHDSERKAIKRVYPTQLTDLFRGEQLVMVGRYRTAGPTNVVLTGDVNGRKKTFKYEGKLEKHSTSSTNSYVEKLWATRRIGEIIDQLDLNGRNQELIDELVALSLKHGIMTPYTSFLADENVQLTDNQNGRRAGQRLESLDISGGRSGFAQRDFKRSLQSAPNAPASQVMDSFGLSREGKSMGFGGGGLGSGSGLGGGGGRTSASRPSRLGGAKSNSKKSRGGGLGQSADKSEESDEEESLRPAERVRRIASKTFYWKKIAWIDAELSEPEYKDAAVVEIEQYSKEYFELAAKDQGKWSKFLSLKEPIELLLGGKRYRIVPTKPAKQASGTGKAEAADPAKKK